MSRPFGIYPFDRQFQQDRQCVIAGVDEAGRGPLAGPVIAAAVVLDLEKPIRGVNDSKCLTEEKREWLYEKIVNRAKCWAVGEASPREIDRINILHASLLAMKRALDQIQGLWTVALIDGNQPIRELAQEMQQTVVDGDAKSASIAAASIIAKVTRDRMMKEYGNQYPGYSFEKHKGYATALHRARLIDLGMCAIHRRSFCYSIVAQTKLPLEFST